MTLADKLRAKLPNASEAFLKANAGILCAATTETGTCSFVMTEVPVAAKKRIRQSARPLENKLEMEFGAYLQAQFPHTRIYVQARRYRLGNGLWYKPDYVRFYDNREIVYEVKGPHAFRGGFENLKMAATTYPETEWWLAWKDAGHFVLQKVLS